MFGCLADMYRPPLDRRRSLQLRLKLVFGPSLFCVKPRYQAEIVLTRSGDNVRGVIRKPSLPSSPRMFRSDWLDSVRVDGPEAWWNTCSHRNHGSRWCSSAREMLVKRIYSIRSYIHDRNLRWCAPRWWSQSVELRWSPHSFSSPHWPKRRWNETKCSQLLVGRKWKSTFASEWAIKAKNKHLHLAKRDCRIKGKSSSHRNDFNQAKILNTARISTELERCNERKRIDILPTLGRSDKMSSFKCLPSVLFPSPSSWNCNLLPVETRVEHWPMSKVTAAGFCRHRMPLNHHGRRRYDYPDRCPWV